MSVRGIIGAVGSGKTFRLAELGLNAIRRGDRVYANFHFGVRVGCALKPCKNPRHEHYADSAGGRYVPELLHPMSEKVARRAGLRYGYTFVASFEQYTYFDSWDALIPVRRERDEWNNPVKQGVTVLVDEINVLAPSRLHASFPVDMLQKWAMNRKEGLDIWWSAQRESRVDKVIRELTGLCYYSRGIGFKNRPLFYWRTEYVPRPDDADPTKAEEQLKGSFWHSSFSRHKSSVFRRYDTYEPIQVPGHLREAAERRALRRRGEMRVSSRAS